MHVCMNDVENISKLTVKFNILFQEKSDIALSTMRISYFKASQVYF